jgi:dTDP-4-amino-4,6-dideoxygalactose transaminase
MDKRIFLSPPHMGGQELSFVIEAFDSNYIAPAGPQLDTFEKEFAHTVGVQHSAAVTSGTAAQHLLLRYVGVQEGDEVLCSSFTFVPTANAIMYCGATPVFIDSDDVSWNMDPNLLGDELALRATQKRLPKAVVLVHLYGQPADIDAIQSLCDTYGIPLIEDAAESLGARYKGCSPGTFGLAGFFSFNGNKIITTSGGGMIVSNDEQLIQKVKFWSTQARENTIHYEHAEIGYNYRMSNILAAIGRGQLRVLLQRVVQKRRLFTKYQSGLADLPGLNFMPEPGYSYSTRWLTCLTIDPDISGTNRDVVIQELEEHNIESRPTWKPMHMQPLYKHCQVIGGSVSKRLFEQGLCLPSGTAMTDDDVCRVVEIVRSCWD